MRGVTQAILALALRVNVKYIHFGYPAEMWDRVRGELEESYAD